jgi:hypothetical protein
LHTTKQQYRDNRAGISDHHWTTEEPDAQETTDNQCRSVNNRDHCRDASEKQTQTQRLITEAKDCIQRVLQQSPEILFWFTGKSRRAIVINYCSLESNPGT